MAASIYDIAKEVGVSAVTVSNVLNNKGRFSQKTKELVLKAAQRQGYVPNLTAKGLRESHSKTVGIVTPDVSNDYFATIVLDIERAMYAKGYASYICDTSNTPAICNEYLQNLKQRGIDGVFMVGGAGGEDFTPIHDTPCVLIDYTGKQRPERYFCAGNDFPSMMRDQVDHLVGTGCRQIALITVETAEDIEDARTALAPFRKRLQELGVDHDLELEFYLDRKSGGRSSAREKVADELAAGKTFDGIAAIGDRLALGALEAARSVGMGIGTDVKIIGLDDSLYSQLSYPAISTINRNTDQMAHRGIKAMLAMLSGDDPAEREIAIPHRLVIRASTVPERP